MMLGVVQSFFEGSMYTFVLEWTPALTPQSSDVISKPTIPHGLIFASFMVGFEQWVWVRNLVIQQQLCIAGKHDIYINYLDTRAVMNEWLFPFSKHNAVKRHVIILFQVAVMIGSSVFKLASRFFSIESFMRFVLLTSASSLAIPVFFPEVCLFGLLLITTGLVYANVWRFWCRFFCGYTIWFDCYLTSSQAKIMFFTHRIICGYYRGFLYLKFVSVYFGLRLELWGVYMCPNQVWLCVSVHSLHWVDIIFHLNILQ